ncbi:MAG: septation protein SepH [Propionibacteriaceae bacterium]|nr:septation protein SepH [Propionibacteriaceae bacterium]
MQSAMTPRDIQMRIRCGESLEDVIAQSGMPADRVEGFAAPILAERHHITETALASAVRRQGETVSSRRLRQAVAEALLETGQDIDDLTWDSWRRSDGRWIVQGTSGQTMPRFLYDSHGNFSVAENDQARIIIGDLPLRSPVDSQGETTGQLELRPSPIQFDLGEEPTVGLPPREDEDSVTSGFPEDSLRNDIDLLYDMISTTDEDSVRIFRGLRESPTLLDSPDQPSLLGDGGEESTKHLRGGSLPPPPTTVSPRSEPTPATPLEETKKPRKSRKRASVPAWDDIIFGGKS